MEKIVGDTQGADFPTLAAFAAWAADSYPDEPVTLTCYGEVGEMAADAPAWPSGISQANRLSIEAGAGGASITAASGAGIAIGSCFLSVRGLTIIGQNQPGIVFDLGLSADDGQALIDRCVFQGSFTWGVYATRQEGAADGDSAVTVRNCLFTGTYSQRAVAGFNDSWNAASILGIAVQNCSLHVTAPYGIQTESASAQGNAALAVSNTVVTGTIAYLCIAGESPVLSQNATADNWAGAGGLVNQDPADLFIDADAGNLRLPRGSALINAGGAIAEVDVDLLGIARPQMGAWDIGAYEYVNPVGCRIIGGMGVL
jgi:hypothetical protein